VRRLAQARRPETQVYGLGSDVVFDCLFGLRAPPFARPHEPQEQPAPIALKV